MNPVIYLIIGIIFTIGIWWQINIFRDLQWINVELPKSIAAPVVLGGVILGIAILYSIFLLITDPGDQNTQNDALGITLGAMFFGVILTLKTMFGPILNACIISYAIYMYDERGGIEVWPVMEWIVHLFLANAGRDIVILYTLAFLVFSLIVNGWSVLEGH